MPLSAHRPKPITAASEFLLYRRLFGWKSWLYLPVAWAWPGRFRAALNPPGAKRRVRVRLGNSDVWVYRGAFLRRHHRLRLNPAPRVIVDAGANIGMTTVDFARRFRGARVIAIEPEAGNFRMLEGNIQRYGRIEAVRAAVWRANEPLRFTNEGTDADSLQVGAVEAGGRASTPGMTMERLMEDHGIERIDLLKVDIEGAEREVFANASGWIDRVDALIVEIHEFLREGCEASVLEAVRGFEFVARSRLHLLAVRERRRLVSCPPQYRETRLEREATSPMEFSVVLPSGNAASGNGGLESEPGGDDQRTTGRAGPRS